MSELKVILTPEIESFISNTFNKDVSANGDVRCYGRFEYTRKKDDPEHQYIASHIDANLLPSRFQLGDKVILNFGNTGKVTNCEVIKIHFTGKYSPDPDNSVHPKVQYDVQVVMREGDIYTATRLYNIDSCFVEPAE